MTPFRAGLVLLLFLAALPAAVSAQVVRGEVRAENDGAPVPHVFVLLLDSAGRRVGGALTDSLGRYALRAPRPGRYRLRAERIGYGTPETALTSLGEAAVVLNLVLPPDAISLVPLTADARGRGCPRQPDGAAVQQLWEDIRKALHVTEWSQRSGGHRYTLLHYTRHVSPDASILFREQRDLLTLTTDQPFHAAAAEELGELGFMRVEGAERVLLGPDATVLLSDAFLDNHCFSLAPTRDRAAQGLSFTPLPDRRQPDIQGVLWVDRATRELRSVLFRFVNLPRDLQRHGAEGEVHFRSLPDGRWIVERWWIRNPLFGGRSNELLGRSEEGGTTISARSMDAELLAARPTGSIRGVVRDSLQDERPLANALVFLSGAPQQAVTDERGHFELVGVPPGRHFLVVSHPLLEGLDGERRLVPVDVANGAVEQDLATPSRRTLYRSLCPDDRAGRGTALLLGVVHDDADAPIAGAEVRIAGAGDTQLGPRRPVVTDTDGRYHFCWVPERSPMLVRLLLRNQLHRTDSLAIIGPVLRHDIELRRR